MEPQYQISNDVRAVLRKALLEEHDLIDSLRQQRPVEVPESPSVYAARCLVAVRRPLDLETSELRNLTVKLRHTDSGWLIVGIDGLADAIA